MINITMRYFIDSEDGCLLYPAIKETIRVPITSTINDIIKPKNIDRRRCGWWVLNGVVIDRCDFDKPIVELLGVEKQEDISNINYLVKVYKTGEVFYNPKTGEYFGGA